MQLACRHVFEFAGRLSARQCQALFAARPIRALRLRHLYADR
jgi:hypothetical protein